MVEYNNQIKKLLLIDYVMCCKQVVWSCAKYCHLFILFFLLNVLASCCLSILLHWKSLLWKQCKTKGRKWPIRVNVLNRTWWYKLFSFIMVSLPFSITWIIAIPPSLANPIIVTVFHLLVSSKELEIEIMWEKNNLSMWGSE